MRILELIYQPDTHYVAKENMVELLEFLAQHSEDFKEYVYQILKKYSETGHSKFLKTNIVDFMNALARERRAKLFGDDTIDALSL